MTPEERHAANERLAELLLIVLTISMPIEEKMDGSARELDHLVIAHLFD